MSNALTVSGTLTFNQGTLNTNGQTCSFGTFTSQSGLTRVLTMGASAISVSGTTAAAWGVTVTGMTITANTATVTLSGAAAGFFTSSTNWNGLSVVFTGSGNPTVNGPSGTLTLANLTRTGTAVTTDSFTPLTGTAGNLVITGTLTVNGNSVINRVLVTTSTQGSAISISAGAVSFSNVDFRDITAAGAAIPWTGTSLGDALGNTNITFTAPVTRYWVGGTGNWSSTTHWSASDGGAGSASVPLAHDSVFFTANSGAGTVTCDVVRLAKDIDMSASSVLTWAATVAGNLAGNLSLKSGMTLSYNPSFVGRSSFNFTTNGATFSGGSSIVMGGIGGTINFMDNINATTSYGIFHRSGTMNTNNVTFTVGTFNFDNNLSTRVFNAGSSTFNLGTTGTIWNTSNVTGLTMNMGTSVINYTAASASARTFAGAGFTYGTLAYNVAASSGALTITGSNTFTSLDLESTVARTVTLPAAGTQTVTGELILKGRPSNLLSVVSSSGGSAATISKASGIPFCEYLSLTDITVTGGANFDAAYSTDVSGNTGWNIAPSRLPNFGSYLTVSDGMSIGGALS